MSDAALFIPLKAEYYEAFERGEKDTEYRPLNNLWNSARCYPGRRVILSYGYGKRRRLTGRIKSFSHHRDPSQLKGWNECYGIKAGFAACICIDLDLMTPKP